jgi:N-methylhydantoinase B
MQLPDGTTRRVPSKGAFVAPSGSLIILDVPGSGGFGPPAERNPALLRRDLSDGYVTEAAVRHEYGLDPATLPDDLTWQEAAS